MAGTLTFGGLPTNIEQQVLLQVFQNVRHCGILNCRFVCKKWNQIIISTPSINSRLVFVFDGTIGTRLANNIEALLRSVPFWRHFKFMNWNMGRYLLANPTFFEYFVLTFRYTIRSLYFENCLHFSIGRLMELLAFCKAIRTVHIDSCPHLYNTTLDNFGDYLPLVAKNLMNLEEFSIMANNVNLNIIWPDVLHLLHNLRSLQILTTTLNVPSRILTTLILQNKNLQELSLGCGGISLTQLKTILSSEIQLRALSLHGMTLPSHFPFSTPALKTLQSLGLNRCYFFDTSNGQNSPHKHLFRQATHLSRLKFGPVDYKSLETTLKYFFMHHEWKNFIELELHSIPKQCLRPIFLKTPNVTSVSVTDSIVHLSHFSTLKNLQKLCIDGGSILGENPADSVITLASALTHLTVIYSDFGDDLLQFFEKVATLRGIYLDQTKVTNSALQHFIQSAQKQMPQLEELEIFNCPNCHLTFTQFQNLMTQYLPKVRTRYENQPTPTNSTLIQDDDNVDLDFYS